MTALKTPAADAPDEKWGRLAVWIPRYRWMPGMLVHFIVDGDPRMYRLDGVDGGLYEESWILVNEHRINDDTDDVSGLRPDLDDLATAGCLLALVGPCPPIWSPAPHCANLWTPRIHRPQPYIGSLGRACIATAAAVGRWPGGNSGPACPDCGGSISEHQHYGHHGPEWRCPDARAEIAAVIAAATLGRWPGGGE